MGLQFSRASQCSIWTVGVMSILLGWNVWAGYASSLKSHLFLHQQVYNDFHPSSQWGLNNEPVLSLIMSGSRVTEVKKSQTHDQDLKQYPSSNQPIPFSPGGETEVIPPGVPQVIPHLPSGTVSGPRSLVPGVSGIPAPSPITQPVGPPGERVLGLGEVPSVPTSLTIPIYITSSTLGYLGNILSILGLPIFSYLLLSGEDDATYNYQLIAGASYVAASVPIALSIALPPTFAALIALATVAGTAVGLSGGKNQARLRLNGFLAGGSTIAGGTIYALIAGIPSETISPFYFGPAGHLLDKTKPLQDQVGTICAAFIFLVALFSLTSWYLIRRALRAEAAALSTDAEETISWETLLGCFVCSYGISAGLSCIMFFLGLSSFSPLELVAVFTLPTSMRLTEPATYVLIFVWFMLIIVGYWYRGAFSRARDGIKEAIPAGEIPQEQWRLASEGQFAEDEEESSVSDVEEAEE